MTSTFDDNPVIKINIEEEILLTQVNGILLLRAFITLSDSYNIDEEDWKELEQHNFSEIYNYVMTKIVEPQNRLELLLIIPPTMIVTVKNIFEHILNLFDNNYYNYNIVMSHLNNHTNSIHDCLDKLSDLLEDTRHNTMEFCIFNYLNNLPSDIIDIFYSNQEDFENNNLDMNLCNDLYYIIYYLNIPELENITNIIFVRYLLKIDVQQRNNIINKLNPGLRYFYYANIKTHIPKLYKIL